MCAKALTRTGGAGREQDRCPAPAGSRGEEGPEPPARPLLAAGMVAYQNFL
jgi:hypothetical protein